MELTAAEYDEMLNQCNELVYEEPDEELEGPPYLTRYETDVLLPKWLQHSVLEMNKTNPTTETLSDDLALTLAYILSDSYTVDAYILRNEMYFDIVRPDIPIKKRFQPNSFPWIVDKEFELKAA